MSNATIPPADPDCILTQWPANYAFRAKDGLAMISFIVFLMIPMLPALQMVTRALGLPERGPALKQLTTQQLCELLAATGAGVSFVGFVSKYLWLFCMCRLLDRTSVGPLISYGIPRRISAFDRRLVVRFYRDAGPEMETRLVPNDSGLRVYYLSPLALWVGSTICFGVAAFHLVADEPRFWRSGFTLSLFSISFSMFGKWARRFNH